MRLPAYLPTFLFAGFFGIAFTGSRPSHPILPASNGEDSLTGNWTGTSICQVKNSACRDEEVVFHISPGNGADVYKISADKIVNGQAVNMGELNFTFNRAMHTLTCVFPNGTWLLVVNKKHIDGTLTTPDKVLFRKLSLSRAG